MNCLRTGIEAIFIIKCAMLMIIAMSADPELGWTPCYTGSAYTGHRNNIPGCRLWSICQCHSCCHSTAASHSHRTTMITCSWSPWQHPLSSPGMCSSDACPSTRSTWHRSDWGQGCSRGHSPAPDTCPPAHPGQARCLHSHHWLSRPGAHGRACSQG